MKCAKFTSFSYNDPLNPAKFSAAGTTYGAPACTDGDTALLSSSEVAMMLPNQSLFSLTTEAGGQIAVAILLVWVVGLFFRLFIKTLSIGDKSNLEIE